MLKNEFFGERFLQTVRAFQKRTLINRIGFFLNDVTSVFYLGYSYVFEYCIL